MADICRHLEFCQPQKHKKPDLREVSTKVVSVLRSMPKIKTEVCDFPVYVKLSYVGWRLCDGGGNRAIKYVQECK